MKNAFDFLTVAHHVDIPKHTNNKIHGAFSVCCDALNILRVQFKCIISNCMEFIGGNMLSIWFKKI